MNKIFSVLALSSMLAIAGCGKTSTNCTTSNCLNGGKCVDDKCECPTGYMGDCSQEKAPTSMVISKFVVTKFPGRNNGQYWDNTGKAPDIKIYFVKDVTTLMESIYFSDADTTKSYTFTPTSPINIASPNEMHSISMFDDDTPSGEESMDFLSFTPYQPGKKFPAQYTVMSASQGLIVNVYCTYTW